MRTFENYHPYEYLSVYERPDEREPYCSVLVENIVAESLHSFLGRVDDIQVNSLAREDEDRMRFRVNCSRNNLRFLLRKWASAWRAARDQYPPIDVVRVAGQEKADIGDILGKQVRALRRTDETITGQVVEVTGDFSERLCLARLMVAADRSKDVYVTFDEVREFQILPG